MNAYYNEIDPYCCEWLRNLIAEGLIAPGDVDERPIQDVRADDLKGYTQAHFFAGLGGWSYALRLAGVPDDRSIWTGSCPCQPFSAAGKQKAEKDERHLWPEFRRLIAECAPSIVFGEQVASRLGRDWLSVVRLQMEALGYAVGAADLCAASAGAPHIRQRLWFVANADGRNTGTEGLQRSGQHGCEPQSGGAEPVADTERDPADARRLAIEPTESVGAPQAGPSTKPGRRSLPGELDDTPSPRQQPEGQGPEGEARDETRLRLSSDGCDEDYPGVTRTKDKRGCHRLRPWANIEWLPCTDGKQRPTQPGIFPLAHGVPARVAKLRAIGNAISPQTAAAFIKAAM